MLARVNHQNPKDHCLLSGNLWSLYTRILFHQLDHRNEKEVIVFTKRNPYHPENRRKNRQHLPGPIEVDQTKILVPFLEFSLLLYY